MDTIRAKYSLPESTKCNIAHHMIDSTVSEPGSPQDNHLLSAMRNQRLAKPALLGLFLSLNALSGMMCRVSLADIWSYYLRQPVSR